MKNIEAKFADLDRSKADAKKLDNLLHNVNVRSKNVCFRKIYITIMLLRKVIQDGPIFLTQICRQPL